MCEQSYNSVLVILKMKFVVLNFGMLQTILIEQYGSAKKKPNKELLIHTDNVSNKSTFYICLTKTAFLLSH